MNINRQPSRWEEESDCRCQMDVSIFDQNRSHGASCHLSAASSTAKTTMPAAATFAADAITSEALTFNADAVDNCGYGCRALFSIAEASCLHPAYAFDCVSQPTPAVVSVLGSYQQGRYASKQQWRCCHQCCCFFTYNSNSFLNLFISRVVLSWFLI